MICCVACTDLEVTHHSETLGEYELMDGAPVKGKQICFHFASEQFQPFLLSSDSDCALCVANRRVDSDSHAPGAVCADPELHFRAKQVLGTCLLALDEFLQIGRTNLQIRYFLNLVLMDDDGRRYFKKQVSDCFADNLWLRSLTHARCGRKSGCGASETR